MDQLWQERLKKSGIDVNPPYVQSILEMDDARFEKWFTTALVGVRMQEVEEFFAHLHGNQPDRPGTCRLGVNIIADRLTLLGFVLKERYAKFDALEASSS